MGAADDGGNQTTVNGHGHGNVGPFVIVQHPILPRCVGLWNSHQGLRNRFEDKVIDGQFVGSVGPAIELRPQSHGRIQSHIHR